MSQVVACPNCAKKLKAPAELAGKRVQCPACKAPLLIPPLAKSTPAMPDASNASATPAASTKSSSATAAPAGKSVIECPKCAKKLKAPDGLAGKRVACPGCKTPFVVPPSSSASPQKSPPRPPNRSMLGPSGPPPVAAMPSVLPKAGVAARQSAAAVAPTRPRWSRPRFLYLLVALTFVPLGFQTYGGESDVEERLERTLTSHPELADQLKGAESDDDFFSLLPDHRIEGAHLPRETWVHWLYALLSAVGFFLLMWLLFEHGQSTPMHLATVGLVTGTVGIISLLAFQWIAEFTQGFWLRGGSIIVILFYVIKLIGFSYHAALDPENGFGLSFLGFTCGVGLCEELTKIVPVLFLIGNDHKLGWRAACVIGLASGVGFGVAEGIMYSSSYYNGVTTVDIYLTRFISCVALHAVWAAAAGIQAVHNRAAFDNAATGDLIFNVLWIIAVPAILHGLYDTLLKREMSGLALVVAALSFVWLIWMVERARNDDSELALSRVAQRARAAGRL